jgi:hypothetical protein
MPILCLTLTIFLSTSLVRFFSVLEKIQLSKASHQEDCYFPDGTEDLSTTVKLDNTLENECRTEIYLAAVPCNGMKKELPLLFAAVILLIILTGTAQTETLLNLSSHPKKAASRIGLHSWRCDNNNNNNDKRRTLLYSIAYLFCSLEL